MLENVKRIIRHVVYYFEEYLDAIGVEPSAEDDERFGFILTNFELVRGLFLFGTSHDGGASTLKKCRELGVDPSDENLFADGRAFDMEEEEGDGQDET